MTLPDMTLALVAEMDDPTAGPHRGPLTYACMMFSFVVARNLGTVRLPPTGRSRCPPQLPRQRSSRQVG